MSTITFYGPPQSSFMRTARMVCEEKGIDYKLEEVDFGSDAYREHHPFNKVPSMRHGDFDLYETAAIARYLEETFDGPSLVPADANGRARMTQWISAINDYYYQAMIRELVFPRIVVPMRGGETDEEMVKAAMPKIDHQFAVANDTLSQSDYLAGDALSVADLFLLPIVFYVNLTPEGSAALKKAPAVGKWLERMSSRPSFAATLPPMPEAAE